MSFLKNLQKISKKYLKKFARIKIMPTFASAIRK